MDIIRVTGTDTIFPSHLSDLLGGINRDVLVVQTLSGIDAVRLAFCIVVYPFIGYAQFIIGIGG